MTQETGPLLETTSVVVVDRKGLFSCLYSQDVLFQEKEEIENTLGNNLVPTNDWQLYVTLSVWIFLAKY